MSQINLFTAAEVPVEFMKDGMLHRQHSWGLERNFHGFRQTKTHGEEWMFYVRGFTVPALPDGSDSIGNVRMFDGGYMPCQMDIKGRIFVEGRWYGRNRWDH